MPKTRLTEFSVLSIDPRAGISRSTSETDYRFCLSNDFFIVGFAST